MNYTVSNGTGTRRVVAESKLEALTKATGRDASRFAILEGHPPYQRIFQGGGMCSWPSIPLRSQTRIDSPNGGWHPPPFPDHKVQHQKPQRRMT